MKTSRLIRSNIVKQSITADANCFELRELISACLACLFIILIGLLLVSHVAGIFLAKIMLVPCALFTKILVLFGAPKLPILPNSNTAN